jgi:hypothetical protein
LNEECGGVTVRHKGPCEKPAENVAVWTPKAGIEHAQRSRGLASRLILWLQRCINSPGGIFAGIRSGNAGIVAEKAGEMHGIGKSEARADRRI